MPFVVFSQQTTSFIKHYCAKVHESSFYRDPLFLDKGELTIGAVQQAFRKASKAMGFTEPYKANPFRPKRFRHLLRNACAIAKIELRFYAIMQYYVERVDVTSDRGIHFAPEQSTEVPDEGINLSGGVETSPLSLDTNIYKEPPMEIRNNSGTLVKRSFLGRWGTSGGWNGENKTRRFLNKLLDKL